MRSLLTIILSLFIFSSCCSCLKGSPKIGQLESAKWQLVEFDGKPASGITLTFNGADKMIYGEAPCNNFFASYSLTKGSENNIHIGTGGMTRMACPDMELEMAFAAKLESVVTVKMEQTNMLLLDNSGNLVAIFRSAN